MENEETKPEEETMNAGDEEAPRGGSVIEGVKDQIREEALEHIEKQMKKFGFNKRALRRGLESQLKRNKMQEFDLVVLADEVAFWKAAVRGSDTRAALIGGAVGAAVGIVLFCVLIGVSG